MARMQITKGRTEDWPKLRAIDPNSESNYSYKMELGTALDSYSVRLTRFRLPRTLSLPYHKRAGENSDLFRDAEVVFVGSVQNEIIAFICMDSRHYPSTAEINDLVVMRDARQKGIATILMLSAEKWANQRKLRRLLLTIPIRNDPMISLAKKLGYSFCGYQTEFFADGETALFYEKRVI